MRESADYSNWFTKFEDELPSLEELTPLSQTLITPDLALAFDVSTHAPPHEFNSPEPSAGVSATTLRRPRLVWTPQLHKRFVDAVAQLGIKKAVPKTIMQLMSVDGLTRENVASHLQKYRLYLKRVQGIMSVGPTAGVDDPATDRLFASAPVPAQFLHPAAGNHQGRGIQVVWPYGHFGGFDRNDPFLGPQRMGMTTPASNGGGSYGENLESVGGRKVLTLFPTGDD